jgi:hypothetical protein
MIGKSLVSISLAGVFVTGVYARAWPIHLQDSGKQTAPTTKSVSGRVSSIADSGTSFALAVEGDSKQTLEFVLNQHTQVQGPIKIGTLVAVEYQPAGADGQNLALTITARSS